jgi:hypothetical protein
MEWQFILALVLLAPIILVPVMLVWYLNVAGVFAVMRDRVRKRLAVKQRATVEAK